MNQQGKATLLLLFLSVCASGALLRWSLAEGSDSLTPTELFEVIEHQLTDFRASDLSAAYSHASASFQQNCSLEQFAGMAQGDYRRVLKAERVEYGPWHQQGRRAFIQVFFVHSDGTVLPCIYTLVKERKQWKIDQAQWLRGWATGQRMRGIRS